MCGATAEGGVDTAGEPRGGRDSNAVHLDWRIRERACLRWCNMVAHRRHLPVGIERNFYRGRQVRDRTKMAVGLRCHVYNRSQCEGLA